MNECPNEIEVNGTKYVKASEIESPKNGERAVLVTTSSRGVFFGYAVNVDGDTIKLRRARNCLYWPPEVKGFLGLAESGPTVNSRVGPPADIELRGITSVSTVTSKAVKAWEAAPWK